MQFGLRSPHARLRYCEKWHWCHELKISRGTIFEIGRYVLLPASTLQPTELFESLRTMFSYVESLNQTYWKIKLEILRFCITLHLTRFNGILILWSVGVRSGNFHSMENALFSIWVLTIHAYSTHWMALPSLLPELIATLAWWWRRI